MTIELNKDLRTLADSIKSEMTLSPEGTIEVTKGFGETKIEELSGITVADQKKLSEVHGLYAAATHVAQGELAAQAFKDNAELKMVTSKQALVKDKLTVRTHREKTYPVPNSDRVVTNHCQTAVIWDKFAGGANSKQAKEYVQSMAAELLA